MAAKRMKSVAGHLSCSVCLELYKNPRYLPCYHSYCEDCLTKIQKGNNITCPECMKEHVDIVPPGGLKELPSNFFISGLVDEVTIEQKVKGDESVKCDACIRDDPALVLCLDCGVFLCDHCCDYHKHNKESLDHNVVSLKELKQKDIAVHLKPKPLLCKEHDMALKFYCDTCDQLVCLYCTNKEHNGHDHDVVKKRASKHREQMDQIMAPVDRMINRLSDVCCNVTASSEEIGTQADTIDQHIDRHYEHLQQILQQKKANLKKEVHETCTQKRKALSAQLEQAQFIQAHLASVKGLYGVTKDGSDEGALFVKKQIADDVSRLTISYNQLDVQPVESANLEFIPVDNAELHFPQFGMINTTSFTIVNIPGYAFAGETIGFNILKHRCCLSEHNVSLVVEVRSMGKKIHSEVKGDRDGNFLASFRCDRVGEVTVLVTANGLTVRGSPCTIKVHEGYTKVDQPSKIINLDGKMGIPWGVAFGKDGFWAVADHSNNKIHVFNGQDQLVQTFGCYGKGDGQFDWPYGLAFNEENQIYVSDYRNHRIQKLTIRGDYLLQFGGKGTKPGKLCDPLSVLVHNHEVYIADQINHRISVFTCEGKFCRTIGSDKQLGRPHDLAINGQQQILVANFNHDCITIFTLEGDYVKTIGTKGTGVGHLWAPTSIAVDRHGFILVTEYMNDRVSVFDKVGKHIHCFGSNGSGVGQFIQPRGIALSASGSVYVSDYENKRIQVFSSF